MKAIDWFCIAFLVVIGIAFGYKWIEDWRLMAACTALATVVAVVFRMIDVFFGERTQKNQAPD